MRSDISIRSILSSPLRAFAFLWLFAIFIPRASQAAELHLLCWTEYVPKTVIEGFERKTGAKVLLEHYNSNEQLLAMLKAKPAYYDLVQPSGFYVETLAKQGGLEILDYSNIPNAKHLDPKYRGLMHDPENRYSVPWLAGTVGIVVNTERVKEPITTWADVFSGKHSGRIAVVDDHREMAAWALASLGMPITNVSNEALQKTVPVLEKWLPQIAVFDSDSPKDALLNSKADIGIVWSGEAAALWLKDRKYRYVLPKEGAHMFLDSLAIPKGAPAKALAEEFINHCLEPKASVLISNEYPYTNPNLAARKLLTPPQRENPASYPPEHLKLSPLRNHGNTTVDVHRFVQGIRDRVRKK
ncbi:MAG TPA: spermidine/putrescine ABC transporter substrate-binding protein [Verrucomicrobiae bacterium]